MSCYVRCVRIVERGGEGRFFLWFGHRPPCEDVCPGDEFVPQELSSPRDERCTIGYLFWPGLVGTYAAVC